MRVAIVCYYSPPQAAIAAHRVLRMTRALQAAGHAVHWVTADAGRLDPAALDTSLEALVPASVVVHGIDGQALITKPAAANLREKILRTLAWHAPRRFRYPDAFVSWAHRLRRQLPALVAREGIEAVLLCCSPHNQILALPRLRRAHPGLQVFVDYRDLLSGNPWNPRASARQARVILDLERRMLRHADALFLNTEAARDRFSEVVGVIDGLAVEVMRNAADYALAAEVAAAGPAPRLGDGRHIGFFGTLFPRRRLWPVLEAMAAAPDAVREGLTLHVYCDAGDSRRLLEEDLARCGAEVAARVRRHDYLPFAAALRVMQAVDALVLVNGPDADDAVFVPGKLYDYLMARRPILFVGHPGEAGTIVARACGPEACFGHGDAAGLADALGAVVEGRFLPVAEVPEATLDGAFRPLLDRLAATSRSADVD